MLGLLVCGAVAAAAMVLGHLLPVVGAPVFAIALGVALRQAWTPGEGVQPGLRLAGRTVLQIAVVLFGARLTLQEVAQVGWSSLPVLLGTLVLALGAGGVLSRLLGVERDVGTLVTVGTAICGASAIATIGAVVQASTTAIAVSVAVIFTYNVLAAVLFPLLGHLMGMPQETFGLWAGTAINDTSSVVAAATAYGAVAASTAVVVKLSRTLAIIPLAVWHARRNRSADVRVTHLVPPFLLFFVLAAAARSLGLVPDLALDPLQLAAVLATSVAMAGIGLQTPVSAIRAAGWRPLALGGLLWLVVSLSALALIAAQAWR